MYLGTEHKIKATTATLGVLAVLLLVMLWVHFRTPIPPYPEDGGQGMGLEISLGYGLAEENPQTPAVESNPEKQEDVLTQDYEEADALPNVEPKKNEKKVRPEKQQTKTQTQSTPPVVDEKALFKKREASDNTDNAGSFGTSGQQGSGIGEGQGTGRGQGIGAGIGNGISFSLEGRARRGRALRTPADDRRARHDRRRRAPRPRRGLRLLHRHRRPAAVRGGAGGYVGVLGRCGELGEGGLNFAFAHVKRRPVERM